MPEDLTQPDDPMMHQFGNKQEYAEIFSPEHELNPEIQKVLDSKRERINAGNLAVRFGSLREFQEIVASASVKRRLEANEIAPETSNEDMVIWNGLQGVIHPGYYHAGTLRDGLDPGQVHQIWETSARYLTRWPSYRGVGSEGDNIRNYYDKWKAEKSEKSRYTIRMEFIQSLLDEIPSYLKECDRKPFANHEIVSSDMIERMRELGTKKDTEITDDEFRFLIKTVGSFRNVDFPDSPYEVLSIWDKSVLTRYPFPASWKSIEEGTTTDHLLGVVPLSQDKHFVSNIINLSENASEEKPEQAYIVIRMDGQEQYPDPNQDIKYFDPKG